MCKTYRDISEVIFCRNVCENEHYEVLSFECHCFSYVMFVLHICTICKCGTLQLVFLPQISCIFDQDLALMMGYGVDHCIPGLILHILRILKEIKVWTLWWLIQV